MSIDFFKARALSEFDIGQKLREYAINDAWRSNTALWNLISAFAGDASSKIYERMVDMTKNIADVDICDIKHLESISYQFGLKSGYKFIDSLPSEVYELMNVLSVKESYFFRKNGIFSEAGIEEIIDSIPTATTSLVDSHNILDVVIEKLSFVAGEMVLNREMDENTMNVLIGNVSEEKSLSRGLDKSVQEGLINEDVLVKVKTSVIALILDSGKISHDDYKSYAIHGSSLKNADGINIKPANEFREFVNENGEIEIETVIKHSIRIGSKSEISNFPVLERFSSRIWKISVSKFLEVIESKISKTSFKNIQHECESEDDVTKILYNVLENELISKDEFNLIVQNIAAIPYIEVFKDHYDKKGNDFISDLVSSGIIIDESYRAEIERGINEVGFIDAYKKATERGYIYVTRESLEQYYITINYIGEFANEFVAEYGEIKISTDRDILFVFDNNEWVMFKNLNNRYPSLKAINSNEAEPNSFIQFAHGSQTLKLPVNNVSNGNCVGVQTRFAYIPYYVGVQTFINEIIYRSYYNLIKEKLSCTLNAGNEEDLSVYKEDFLKYTDESGFVQYTNDRNVNFDFYRALVFSHFCSNFYKDESLVGDWFLDSDLYSNSIDNEIDRIDADIIIDEVARVLSDMTLSVAIRREVIKKLAIQYSYIGSVYGVEKTINDFVLRNFTSRNKDWNFRSGIATENDYKLPKLEDIKKKFNVEVVEYYDSTEYLNISAESAKQMEFVENGTINKYKSEIDLSGNLVTSIFPVSYPIYRETEYPVVSGGNEAFWKSSDYFVKLNNDSANILEFYKHVDGVPDKVLTLEGVSSLLTTLWENCALSSLIEENADMHNKYIGDGTGYMTAVNSGNQNYPTIAPIPTLTNMTETYGNAERDYQSVLNDDRPDIVEGVAIYIASAFQCVPVADDFIGTEREIVGKPPFLSYPIEDYVRTKTEYKTVNVMVEKKVDEVISFDTTQTVVETIRGINVETYYVPSSYTSSITSSFAIPLVRYNTLFEGTNAAGNFSITKTLNIEGFDPNNSDGTGTYDVELSGLVSDLNMNITPPEAWLENVTITRTEELTYVLSEQSYCDDIKLQYELYEDDKHFVNGSANMIGITASFNETEELIKEIHVDYYEDNAKLTLEDIFDTAPATNSKVYSFNPNDVVEDIYDEDGNIIGTSSMQMCIDEIRSVINSDIKGMFDSAYYNKIKTYSEKVISGYITEGSVITKIIDNPYYDLETGEYHEYEEIIKANITPEEGSGFIVYWRDVVHDISAYAQYDKQIDAVRDSFYDEFADSYYSAQFRLDDENWKFPTLNDYNRLRDRVAESISLANDLNKHLVEKDEYVTEVSVQKYDLTNVPEDLIIAAFGESIIERIDKTSNRLELDVERVDYNQISTYVSSFIVDTEIQRQREVPWEEQVSSQVTVPSSYVVTKTVYVEEEQTEEIQTQITSYMIIESDGLNGTNQETPYLFDIYGGLINSWRNVNVELKGYQSCYEASPNLTKNYVENKYVDVDGPWVGDALYDLIATITPLFGEEISANISEPIPQPSSLNAEKFMEDHRLKSGEINRTGKWHLSEYTEYLKGHNTINQLKIYTDDIMGCRNKSVFEIEVDSFGNQYTLYKDKKDDNDLYDDEGQIWMRHANFPFSFPIMQPPRNGWEDMNNFDLPSYIVVDGIMYYFKNEKTSNGEFIWENTTVNDGVHPSVLYTQTSYPLKYTAAYNRNVVPKYENIIVDVSLESPYQAFSMNTDQIYIGYTMNNYRSIFNRCLAFGINNTSLWAAGYDGKNSDGSDHFNIRIIQNKYFNINGTNYYGNRNPRTMNKFNADPVGFDSNDLVAFADDDEYKWLDFCGGYYDGDVINFVFYGKSGFRFRVYNLTNARLNNDDIIAEFRDIQDDVNYDPWIDEQNPKNPFRLVEDNKFCYIGWVTADEKLAVCQNDKTSYEFSSILQWDFPETETSREIKSLVAGVNMIKVMMKSGNVYYGRMDEKGFTTNKNHKLLVPFEQIAHRYITDDETIKLPKIPIIDITQWRHWSYSLTTNSLYTIDYSDIMNIESLTSAAISKTGVSYNAMARKTYIPGNFTDQSVVAYDPYSGIRLFETAGIILDKDKNNFVYLSYTDEKGKIYEAEYVNGKWKYDDINIVNIADLTEGIHYEVTGYDIGKEFYELTPYLQQVIPSYAPCIAIKRFEPTTIEAEALSAANVSADVLQSYYGLPYNNLYVERTDLNKNADTLIDTLNPRIESNWLVLKNFYNYGYEHEYSWNPVMDIPDNSEFKDKFTGWRKYLKCSISRYSDTMWMSYNFLRDYNVLAKSNKQQSVAYIMNDFEFVEVVYGTIQLMNSNYCKSNVFSIKINESKLNKSVYPEETEEQRQMRENAMAQIKDQIREMIGNYAPIHTQLWKIEFNG